MAPPTGQPLLVPGTNGDVVLALSEVPDTLGVLCDVVELTWLLINDDQDRWVNPRPGWHEYHPVGSSKRSGALASIITRQASAALARLCGRRRSSHSASGTLLLSSFSRMRSLSRVSGPSNNAYGGGGGNVPVGRTMLSQTTHSGHASLLHSTSDQHGANAGPATAPAKADPGARRSSDRTLRGFASRPCCCVHIHLLARDGLHQM